ATLNGLLMGLDRKVDLAVLMRHFPRNYKALFPTPFAETTGARNETGLYLGLEVRPHRYWKLSAYFDAWHHPWLRFDADAPSRGYEYRARLTYFRKRNLEAYLEVRDETKERNIDKIGGKNNFTLPSRVFQTRLHLAKKVNKALELRSRIDIGFSENEINTTQRGFVIYQDVIFKPIGFPLSFTTRFALFDTDGFQARYYSFENNLLYAFSIPAYYNRGTRFYLNLRYRGIRNLTLEARVAQTYWRNQDSIGSGLDEVAGPRRTELGAQVKYRF
ncbi:MAG: helix-hairpin-helix domain-containing protein, partial [Phaeodactylibacter sp.]|nr:helix-hairpin-helix domain-containing protein [Phaeodactylibacter sp.]